MTSIILCSMAAGVYICSFCGKSQLEVKNLIAGPGVFICNECVQLCQPIISNEVAAQGAGEGAPLKLTSDNMPTENLLILLVGFDRNLEACATGMQETVHILREREVSWTAIGDALGVSRQAVRKRFA